MNKFPFTATQWQELEHQALIFKYMVSGIPIPPDLLFAIKRSFLDPNSNSNNKLLLSHHHNPQHVGWNCFQMGLGRKVDPEPGRCRRTDGKKWRCSKEAFPESKYCERHMHRGKNRSRKPVEVFKTTTNNNTNTSTISTPLIPPNKSNNNNFHYYPYNEGEVNSHVVGHNPSFVYQYHTSSSSSSTTSSSSRPSGMSNSNSTPLLFDSDIGIRNRYVYNNGGTKEEVDEHAFFSEEPSRASRDHHRNIMDDSWQLTPLTMSCSSSTQIRRDHSAYDGREDHSQRTIHFFDDCPVKEKGSWLDLDDKSSNNTTTTQLSISMPKSSYDFPIFSSTRNGD